MTNNRFIAIIATVIFTITTPIFAQDIGKDAKASDKEVEKQVAEAKTKMKAAQKQYEEALRKLREAERAVRRSDMDRQDAEREAIEEMIKDNTGNMTETRIQLDKEVRRMMAEKEAQAYSTGRKVVIYEGNRARIGVVLRTGSDDETDKIGAVVEGLTPGGPAEEAGVKVGDIILKLNGESLLTGEVDVDKDESAPAARLLKIARKLKEGDKVTLEVKRGNGTKTIELVSRRMGYSSYSYITPPSVPRAPRPPRSSGEPFAVTEPDMPPPPHQEENNFFNQFFSDYWRDLELVELNADLGEYFGSSTGLLIIRTTKQSPGELKAGDVILKIGDRTPTRSSQVFRILRSFEPGETVPVEIMRNKQKMNINIKVPERKLGSIKSDYFGVTPEVVSVTAKPAPVAQPKPVAPVVAPRSTTL